MYNIIYLLYTLLNLNPKKFSNLIEPKEHEILTHNNEINKRLTIQNLSREILYESLISIDSIIFLLETNAILIKDLETFIKATIFETKKLLLKRPNVFLQFSNFSTKVEAPNSLIKQILKIRNKLFELDKSQIALLLTKQKFTELKSRIDVDLTLYDDQKENEYLRMIKSIFSSKNSEDGIQINLSKEKYEFYRENIDLTKQQIFDSKVSLNLGGSIFDPALLTTLIKKMTVQNKREIVKKTILSFFEPLLLLKRSTDNKTFIEKKKQILEFLSNCLEIKNSKYTALLDNAFYMRSKLIEYYVKENVNDEQFFKFLDILQERQIKKMIYCFENMTDKQLKYFLVPSKRMIELYLNYICDGQDSSKEKLFKLFEKNELN